MPGGMMKTVLAILTCLFLACLPVVAEEKFDNALAAAKENAKKPGGKEYEEAVGLAFAEKHVNTMVRCTKSATEADLAEFDLMMRIAKDGTVGQALVRPETKVASCLLESVRGDSYPVPPEPDYWVQVHMDIRE